MSKGQKALLIAIGIAVLYAIILRLLFGVDTWDGLFRVMSVSFLFFLPVIVGILTVYFSNVEQARKPVYRFFAPWIPICIFFVITLALALEGWACWLMVLPLFLLAASLGGFIGGYLKSRDKENKRYISLFALLPFMAAPVEKLVGEIPGTYEAYTYIDIHAPAERIWNNVTRVKAISAEQDKGWLTRALGFPRPVKAELNFNGVGAYRKAIFTGGLVFHETVSAYEEQKKMVFSIKAYPYEIPSTTMDDHVVIGGKYFDVLNGTYELEKLNDTTYRLHLYSHFKLTTTFNFYASWWARWIMKDIQHNILQVEKERAEKGI
ncbi:hypothetical protein [Chitinophaga sp. 212800010-3]|nr:Polyketide cyclase [Chitinophaga sp. 212800010-3]